MCKKLDPCGHFMTKLVLLMSKNGAFERFDQMWLPLPNHRTFFFSKTWATGQAKIEINFSLNFNTWRGPHVLGLPLVPFYRYLYGTTKNDDCINVIMHIKEGETTDFAKTSLDLASITLQLASRMIEPNKHRLTKRVLFGHNEIVGAFQDIKASWILFNMDSDEVNRPSFRCK